MTDIIDMDDLDNDNVDMDDDGNNGTHFGGTSSKLPDDNNFGTSQEIIKNKKVDDLFQYLEKNGVKNVLSKSRLNNFRLKGEKLQFNKKGNWKDLTKYNGVFKPW